MNHTWIKNYDQLANNKNRKVALAIAEAGLDAINTEMVIKKSIKIKDNILFVDDSSFDLSKFKKIKVVGFGKCSCEAAFALEEILKDKITEGAVIGLNKKICKNIKTFAGSHPLPSDINIEPGKEIYEIVKNSTEEDLVIVIVSGGGSALLCYPENECTQGEKLYDAFLKSGKTINELNTVRKHISLLKGGGLAKIAYPSTVIGLIFSDVPGDNFYQVASGTTYKDTSTILDAQNIINTYNLGNFDLIETPKEDVYFEKVHNFVLVSNKTALEAMSKKSTELGFPAQIVSSELYGNIDEVLETIFSNETNKTTILAAGEPKIIVTKSGGQGGRNMHMGLKSISKINEGSVFIPLASDGMDNSDGAGAIVDKETKEHFIKNNLDINEYIENFDSYNAFKKSGDMIMTGPTNANVSDLMILFTNKNEYKNEQ
jgi:glycerate 2-kinase